MDGFGELCIITSYFTLILWVVMFSLNHRHEDVHIQINVVCIIDHGAGHVEMSMVFVATNFSFWFSTVNHTLLVILALCYAYFHLSTSKILHILMLHCKHYQINVFKERKFIIYSSIWVALDNILNYVLEIIWATLLINIRVIFNIEIT